MFVGMWGIRISPDSLTEKILLSTVKTTVFFGLLYFTAVRTRFEITRSLQNGVYTTSYRLKC